MLKSTATIPHNEEIVPRRQQEITSNNRQPPNSPTKSYGNKYIVNSSELRSLYQYELRRGLVLIKAVLHNVPRLHVFVGLRMQADSAAGEEIFAGLAILDAYKFAPRITFSSENR